jgi:hypothetical protein
MLENEHFFSWRKKSWRLPPAHMWGMSRKTETYFLQPGVISQQWRHMLLIGGTIYPRLRRESPGVTNKIWQ